MQKSTLRCGSAYNHHPNAPRPSPTSLPRLEPVPPTRRPPARELSPKSVAECLRRSRLSITTTNITPLDVVSVLAAELMGRRRTEYIIVREPSTPDPWPRPRLPRHPHHFNQLAAPPARLASPPAPTKAAATPRPSHQPARKPAVLPDITNGNPEFEPSPQPRRMVTCTTPTPASPAKLARRPLTFPKTPPCQSTCAAETACVAGD